MRRAFALVLLAFPAGAVSGEGTEPSAFPVTPVEEQALADMRGGFGLPGGVDIAIAIQSDTAVNGALVLRSVFLVGQGAPSLDVYARREGIPTGPADPAAKGVTASFSVSSNAWAIGGAPEGLTKLELSRDGQAAAVGEGSVRVEKAGAGSQVVLSQPTLDVRHLVGDAVGSIAANRTDGVSIDTVTNINIDLKNATPLNLGSTMVRVETLALDAAARMPH